jgi:hypothetical protein
MNLEKRLEDKAREYLKSREMPLSHDYVEYITLEEDNRLPDGSVKSMHMLLFITVSEGDLTQFNFICADATTEKLEYWMSPHTSKFISDQQEDETTQ